MSKIIIANWKMAPDSVSAAENLLLNYLKILKESKAELVIIPPFVYLSSLKIKYKNIKCGAQDFFWINRLNEYHFTGEISVKMLKNLGVSYAIAGHSERRKYLNETNEMVNKKMIAGLEAGLKMILCVGEDLLVRKRGKEAVEFFIKEQLDKCLEGISDNPKIKMTNLIIAYEPVWSIGTGQADTAEDAQEVIHFIKNIFDLKFSIPNIKVLYGGSVDGKNINNFVKYNEIDGFLVGGASLKIGEIKKIIEASADSL